MGLDFCISILYILLFSSSANVCLHFKWNTLCIMNKPIAKIVAMKTRPNVVLHLKTSWHIIRPLLAIDRVNFPPEDVTFYSIPFHSIDDTDLGNSLQIYLDIFLNWISRAMHLKLIIMVEDCSGWFTYLNKIRYCWGIEDLAQSLNIIWLQLRQLVWRKLTAVCILAKLVDRFWKLRHWPPFWQNFMPVKFVLPFWQLKPTVHC
jgi:hypothetical protein